MSFGLVVGKRIHVRAAALGAGWGTSAVCGSERVWAWASLRLALAHARRRAGSYPPYPPLYPPRAAAGGATRGSSPAGRTWSTALPYQWRNTAGTETPGLRKE